MTTKKLSCVALLFLLFPGISLSKDGGTKVAVYDIEKIIFTNDDFRDKAAAMQDNFKGKIDALTAMDQEFNTLRSAANPDNKKIAKLQQDFEFEKRAFQQEIQEAQQAVQAEQFKKALDAVESVAKGTWDVTVRKESYAAPEYDITDQVIEHINKQFKKDKAAAKFKGSKPATDNAVKSTVSKTPVANPAA